MNDHLRISEQGSAQIAVLIITIVIMLAAIGAGAYFFYNESIRLSTLTAKVDSLEKNMEVLLEKTKDKNRIINLTIPNIQIINDIFMTAKLSTEPYGTGIKVNGVIVNSTALGHENVKFKIIVGEQSRELTIHSISPGSSKKFEVSIPDVGLDKATSARIQYIESSISYYKD